LRLADASEVEIDILLINISENESDFIDGVSRPLTRDTRIDGIARSRWNKTKLKHKEVK
jgi:hypothetical protein